jgi:hypothetical protein
MKQIFMAAIMITLAALVFGLKGDSFITTTPAHAAQTSNVSCICVAGCVSVGEDCGSGGGGGGDNGGGGN